MALTHNRVRLGLKAALPFGSATAPALLDAFSGDSPVIPHARATQFEIAVFNGDVLDALTDLLSITLELKEASNGVIDTGAPVASRTVAAANFNAALTKDQWKNDQGQHAVFEFSDAEMNVATAGFVDNKKQFGLVVSALANAGRVDLASGIVTMQRSGATGTGMSDPPQPSYTLSDQDILAGLNGKINRGINRKAPKIILECVNDPTEGLLLEAFKPAGGGDPILRPRKVVIPAAS